MLEAAFFLGRARSFRAADNRVLIRSGSAAAEIRGQTVGPTGIRLGVRIAPAGLEIQVAGTAGAGTADLVSALPIQAIHAEIGGLIQGPPESRRRLLDWGVFHVEQGYLSSWRQFRRTLLQRNAAIREYGLDSVLDAWDGELAQAGEALDRQRRAYLAQLTPEFQNIGQTVVGLEVRLRYQPGWTEGEDLRAVLRSGREGDRAVGYTRVGPHRADLQFEIASERSRWRASKGQQKLLGAAMVLAQCALVARKVERSVALVVDEPAADLDAGRLAQFMSAIERCPAQVFLAAIKADGLPLGGPGAMFHVEHGEAKALL